MALWWKNRANPLAVGLYGLQVKSDVGCGYEAAMPISCSIFLPFCFAWLLPFLKSTTTSELATYTLKITGLIKIWMVQPHSPYTVRLCWFCAVFIAGCACVAASWAKCEMKHRFFSVGRDPSLEKAQNWSPCMDLRRTMIFFRMINQIILDVKLTCTYTCGIF